jgi:hypothetical protein
MWVVVLTHRYESPEVIGVFTGEGFAQDYLDNSIDLGDGWSGEVVQVENPEDDNPPVKRPAKDTRSSK